MTKKLEVRTGELGARYESIFGDVAEIIEAARHQAACSVNAVLLPHTGIGDDCQ